MELEHVLPREDPDDEGHHGHEHAPHEQADSSLLQALEESGAGADAHHGDEDREPHVVEGPQGGFGDAAEGALDGSEIAAHQTGDEGAAARAEAEGHAADEYAERTDHDARHDAKAHSAHAGLTVGQ